METSCSVEFVVAAAVATVATNVVIAVVVIATAVAAANFFLLTFMLFVYLSDPFPFGGGVTTLEALSVCTPVITTPSAQTVPGLTAGMILRMQTHAHHNNNNNDISGSRNASDLSILIAENINAMGRQAVHLLRTVVVHSTSGQSYIVPSADVPGSWPSIHSVRHTMCPLTVALYLPTEPHADSNNNNDNDALSSIDDWHTTLLSLAKLHQL